jgi:hypothetical protein
MIVPIYPTKDATIYEKYPVMNTGLDSILELSKIAYYHNNISASNYASRILIQFDTADINNLVEYDYDLHSKLTDGTVNYYLNLYLASAKEIPTNYIIKIYPVSGSWEVGTGKFNESIINRSIDGVSWTYQSGIPSNIPWTTSSYQLNSTGSYNLVPGGGTWYDTNYVTQSFVYNINDIKVDVSSIVVSWLNNEITNDGFIILLDNEYDTDTNYDFKLQYFSKDSHTIFPPKLEVCWDDSVFITSSFSYYTQVASSSNTTTESINFPVITPPITTTNTTWVTSGSIYYDSTSIISVESYILAQPINENSGSILAYGFTGSYVGQYNGQLYGNFIGACTADAVNVYSSSTFISGTASYINTTIDGWFSGYFSGSLSDAVLNGSYSGSYAATFTGSIALYSVNIPTARMVTTYYYTASQNFYVTESTNISRSPIDLNAYRINLKNIKPIFNQNSIYTFIVNGRDTYPIKTFATQSNYLSTKYLPSESYYSIIDAHSNEIILPFNDYTKISYNGFENYFNMIFDGFQTNRYYKLLFKIKSGSIEHYIDNDYIFKVIK